MQKLLKSFLIIALVFSVSDAIAQKTQKAVIKTTINCDHCKVCETCGDLLENTLLKHKGIQMITLDEKEATITVLFNSKKTNLDAIRNEISGLGYDADDVKATPEGYEKLDGCCKI